MGCEKLLPRGDGVQGKGGQVCAEEEQDAMPPFPCPATLVMAETFAWQAWIGGSLSGTRD